MTVYSDFETNREVTDVLFCIVSGHDTVKGMVKTLKQPQSTISTKIQFLLKNKIIQKDKWRFKVNWSKLYKIMYKVLRENSPLSLQLFVKSFISKTTKRKDEKVQKLRAVLRNLKDYFPEDRLKKMLEGYASLFLQGYPKISVSDVINEYIIGLIETDENEVKRIDKRLYKLKLVIGKPSKASKLFLAVEKYYQ